MLYVILFLIGCYLGNQRLKKWKSKDDGDNMQFVYFWDGWF